MTTISSKTETELVRIIDNIKYDPRTLTGHPTRACCDLYDAIASFIYGNHVHPHLDSPDRRVIKHALKLSRWA